MQLGGRVIFAVLLSAQTLVPQFLAQGDLTANAKQPWYRLVDMGTFGGPVSMVFGGAGNLNQQQTLVTSCADTSLLDPNWPNTNPFFGDDPYVQHAFRTRRGSLHDLGALPAGTSSCGQAINSGGVVAGFSTNGEIDPLTGFAQIHAVRWQGENILDLGTLGGNESYANFINDRGQITGGALNAIQIHSLVSFLSALRRYTRSCGSTVLCKIWGHLEVPIAAGTTSTSAARSPDSPSQMTFRMKRRASRHWIRSYGGTDACWT